MGYQSQYFAVQADLPLPKSYNHICAVTIQKPVWIQEEEHHCEGPYKALIPLALLMYSNDLRI